MTGRALCRQAGKDPAVVCVRRKGSYGREGRARREWRVVCGFFYLCYWFVIIVSVIFIDVVIIVMIINIDIIIITIIVIGRRTHDAQTAFIIIFSCLISINLVCTLFLYHINDIISNDAIIIIIATIIIDNIYRTFSYLLLL